MMASKRKQVFFFGSEKESLRNCTNCLGEVGENSGKAGEGKGNSLAPLKVGPFDIARVSSRFTLRKKNF